MSLEGLQEVFVKRSERSYALAILNSSFKLPKDDRQRWPNVNHVFLQDSQDLVVPSLALLFLAGTGKNAVVKLDIPPSQMARLSGFVLYACDY